MVGFGPTFPDGSKPKICIIGAGFSGLTAGIQLKRQLKLSSFTIYDENHDIGGTWLVNTYPGVACDIPSILYSLSFELNPDWPEAYSSSEAILKYMRKLVGKYDLNPHIKLNTEVRATVWDEDAKKWSVALYNKENQQQHTQQFDIVITGLGLLRSPNVPQNFKNFKGPVFHSAEWDHSVDLTDKVVGIIGSGSTAIQIIPAIAKKVKELHCYQRKPGHVAERPQKTYSQAWKLACKYFPPLMWIMRLLIFIKFELFHFSFFPGGKVNKLVTETCKNHLEKQVEDEALRQKAAPGFVYGCKRLLFHNDYYPALQLPNVRLHRGKIQQIFGEIVECEDGSSTKLDVLILATGFKTNHYMDPLKIVGKEGINVNEHWKENVPSSYLGIITHSAPNHFFLLGPNTLLGHSSVLYIMECQVNYIVDGIRQMMVKNIKVVEPKKAIEEKYMDEIQRELKKMVWATGKCEAWYSDGRGNVTALWPYNCLTYWKRTRKFRMGDYETCV